MRKIIALDLDGVLNTYDGKYDKNKISPIKNGAKEFLSKLAENYDIEIFTVREKNLVYKWLKDNNIIQYIKTVTDIKNPRTTIFIDDRALNFCGDFNKTLKEVENFTPHWKNE